MYPAIIDCRNITRLRHLIAHQILYEYNQYRVSLIIVVSIQEILFDQESSTELRMILQCNFSQHKCCDDRGERKEASSIVRIVGEEWNFAFLRATSAPSRLDSRSAVPSSTLGYSRRIVLVSLRLFSSISGFRSASDPAGAQVLVVRRRMLLASRHP